MNVGVSTALKAAALACGLSMGTAYAAATILLWPIDPWLAADRNATELWIENQGNATTTMQVRIVRWRQEGGFERYQAQQDVVASPPILRVEKGQKQLVRLIRQTATPAGVEQAYRIIVDEIPQPANDKEPQIGLKLQMRYSIPLFVYGQGIATYSTGAHPALADPERLSWRIVNDGDGPALEIRNSGDIHVRLSKVNVRQNGQQYSMADGLLGYVLPGEFRRWPLPKGVRQPTQLSAEINARDTQWQSAPGN